MSHQYLQDFDKNFQMRALCRAQCAVLFLGVGVFLPSIFCASHRREASALTLGLDMGDESTLLDA